MWVEQTLVMWYSWQSNLVEVFAVVSSCVAIGVSIRLTKLNNRNSLKLKVYSEDILSSTILVHSSLEMIGAYEVKPTIELLLKIYSGTEWHTWAYKIMQLDAINDIVQGERLIEWFELEIYDSTSHNNGNRPKTFSTKYHCLEYALIKWQLTPNFSMSPFWTERRYK